MKRWLPVVLAIGCARAPLEARKEPSTPSKPERWVDSSAPEGGDGTRARPFKTLALAPDTVVHVATGLYELSGPLPDGVELVGAKAVVLHAAEGLEATRARLQGVAVQGGVVGLTARGEVTLEDVAFSGQRQAAVVVEDGGTLLMTGGAVVGSVPESRGVVTSGRLRLSGTSFKGALRRGVHVTGGTAEVTDASSEGAAEAVHVSAGSARVTSARASGGRGPAFYVMGGRLELRGVKALGHEFAVQAGVGATVDVDGLDAERLQVGGIGAIQAKVTLKRVSVRGAGSHGAVELYDCDSTLDGLTASGLEDVGVIVRLGKLDARNVRLSAVRGSGGSGGDGLMVRDAVVRLRDVFISDIGGTGVVATAVATVDLDGLTCERCMYGALLVEQRATVKAKGIVSIGAREPAVSLPDDGVLELDGLDVQGGGAAVWAECAPGARVILRGKVPARELLSGQCLELPPRPASPDSRK